MASPWASQTRCGVLRPFVLATGPWEMKRLLTSIAERNRPPGLNQVEHQSADFVLLEILQCGLQFLGRLLAEGTDADVADLVLCRT